ncbi:MAG: AMP-binding protein [Clostridia bacterium]|nr:AMP-binding protein [Clostridia bacterium]
MKNIPLYEVRPISNLKEMLVSSTEIFGEKPAFLVKEKGIEGYVPVSYKKFKADVDAFGTALISLGLKDKRIALIGESRYEWAVSYLATVNGTGITVPLDKELPVTEIESLLTRSSASAIIFSGHLKEQIDKILGNISSIKHYICMDDIEGQENIVSFSTLLNKGYQLMNAGDTSFIDSTIDNEAVSMLLFTSGTTDQSKAVMLSHSNICSNLMAMCSMLYIDSSDTFLSILPIHHTYECTCGFLCPLYRGSTIAHCEGLRHIVKNLQESKATVMLGVPLIFEAMYKRIWDTAAKKPGMVKKLKIAIKVSNALRKLNINLTKKLFALVHNNFGGKIRLFISGAAAIDPEVPKGFRSLGIHMVQGYGLTECSPIVALNRDVDFNDRAAGLPLPNLEVKIDNPDDDGIGEIIVKGSSIMKGYYENEEANRKVFKDGWFHTGDAGYMDKEGFIYITGRKKNVIVTKNGKNIYPEEIETLIANSPCIKESMVYGKEDESSGDVVVSCIVVPDMENINAILGEGEASPEKVKQIIHAEIKTVNSKLVNYKHIKNIHIRDNELAKTTTKKIKRFMEEKV